MAQTKTIQLLRSSKLYTPTAAGEGVSAKTALENAKAALTALTGRKDGEIVLARYKETGAEIKSVLGIYHANPDLPSGSTAGWTFIQDVTESEGSAAALQAEIDRIETNVGLGNDGTYTSGYSSDEIVRTPTTLKATVDAIVTFIKNLDKAADAQNGQVVTTVTQTNGLVSETKANVKDLQLVGYSKDTSATGAIGSTDTVNAALSKLENNIAANDTARTVFSSDQSITVANSASGTDVIVNVDGTTIVKDSTSHAIKGNYTLHQLNPTELAALNDANVKEAYRLQIIGESAAIGDVVKVYKDSALQEVYLGANTDTIDASTGVITKNTVTDPQSMNFAYQLADGTYSLTKIDVSKFLTESEFGDGLQVSGAGVVSVKIDSTSESFLTVSSNGIKVSGVQDAITAAINTLDVTDTAVAGQYVSAVSETDGKISVSRANVADAVLTGYTKGSTAPQSPAVAATDDVKGAIAKLEWQIDAVNAGVSNLDAEVTSSGGTNVQVKVTEVDGKITAVNVTTDNTVNSSDVSTAISTAIGALDADLDASGRAQHNGTFVMSGVTEVDGVLTHVDSVEVENAGAAAAAKATIDAYKVNNKAISTNPVLDGSDIALTGYTKDSDATAIAATDTVNQAVSKLENQIDAVETTANGALQSVSSSNGAIAVGTEDANRNQTIGLVLDRTTAAHNITSDMLQITSNGLMMNDAWDCGTY